MPASALENYFLGLVNAARAQAGAAPLLVDEELLAAARVQSAWVDQTEPTGAADPHVGPGGSRPEQRIQAAGYGATRTGENVWFTWGDGVALGQAAVDALHRMLMESPGHRANIVSPEFKEIGIALQFGNYQGRPAVYVTENFGTPTAAEAAETDKSSGVTPTAWQRFELAPPGSASPTSDIAAVSRVPNSLEAWWPGPNGSVSDAFWYEGGTWQRFELAPAGSAAPGGDIAAVSRVPNSLEVWWIAPNGSVQDAFWYDGGTWQRFELAPPGSASTTGGIEAVSRVPNSLEVWWTAPNGSVQDAFWYG